ncbi:MAG: hypothetical protein ACHQNV_03290 [Vicinamibacteria bacterium]
MMKARSSSRVVNLVSLAAVLAAFGSVGASSNDVTRVSLTPEAPDGYADNPSTLARPLRQDIKSLELRDLGGGRFAIRLGEGSDAPALPSVDLRPFVPRIPALAKGDPDLGRFALIQRELNRNQTRFGPTSGADETHIANNCLRAGLWEVLLDKKVESGLAMQYHAWFTFPWDVYGRLFETANAGLKWNDYAKILVEYPKIDGMAAPLEKLRTVVAETNRLAVTTHLDEPLQFLPEQKRKSRLVVTPGIRTYGDFVLAAHQPIKTAKFAEPGLYDSKDPVSFDLTWLKSPKAIAWRRVKGSDGTPMQEVEITYANGYHLIAGDATLGTLSPQAKTPEADKDVLKLTFGIGTPDIYAAAADRAKEFESPRPNYLLLLGQDGRHVDNHHAGVDRLFLWRDDATPSLLHLWLVGYERIAFVSHLTTPWTTP